jgi:hypothetical protein
MKGTPENLEKRVDTLEKLHFYGFVAVLLIVGIVLVKNK